MKLTTKELTLCALLTALALSLSYLENLFPLGLPGLKLGLANVVTLFALYKLGTGQAVLILLARCLLGSVFAGNVSALLFSLTGGLFAMATMVLLRWLGKNSVYGVSIGGSAAHQCGQVAAAVWTLGSYAPLYYLPVLLLTSLLTGSVTGLLATGLFRGAKYANLGD